VDPLKGNGLGPQKKEQMTRIGFSEVMLKTALANVGDPWLVVPGQSPFDTPPSTQLQHEVGS